MSCQSEFAMKRNRCELGLTIRILTVKHTRRAISRRDISRNTSYFSRIQMPSLSSQFNNMSITSDWLYTQILNNSSTVLLLDCRPYNEYSQSHVHTAINLAVPSLMLRRLKKGSSVNFANMINTEEGKRRFAKRDLMDKIVIYDGSTDNLTNTALELIMQRLAGEGLDNIFYLKGGFTTFKSDYPNLCESEEADQSGGPSYIRLSDLRISNDDTSPLKTCAPSSPFNESKVRKGAVEILPNLYLGNARDASDLRELLDRNITYILNVTNDIPNKFENDPRFTYMNLRVQDNWQTNLADHFQEAFKFIDEARLDGKAVLVHCLAGISRSVTVTTAYLMEHEHLSLNDAYDLVKRRKSDISPNFSFMGQLLEFERRLNIPATPSSASSSLSSTSSLEMEISAF